MKPCPFCGSEDEHCGDFELQRSTPDREGVPTRVICGCGAAGPQVYEPDEENFMLAVQAWNNRA